MFSALNIFLSATKISFVFSCVVAALSAPFDILAATLLFTIVVDYISRNTRPVSLAVDAVSLHPFLLVSIVVVVRDLIE